MLLLRTLMVLFAQGEVLPTGTQGWVTLIVQTGAIGILGYHLLFGLPKMAKEQQDSTERMIKTMTESQEKQTLVLTEAFERQVTSLVALFRTTLAEDRKNVQDRNIEDRKDFSDRNNKIVTELTQLRQIPTVISGKLDEMVSQLQQQTNMATKQEASIEQNTINIEKQTATMEVVAKKLSEWPSDADKICKAKEAIRELANKLDIDEHTVEKLIEVKRRQKEREKNQGK